MKDRVLEDICVRHLRSSFTRPVQDDMVISSAHPGDALLSAHGASLKVTCHQDFIFALVVRLLARYCDS